MSSRALDAADAIKRAAKQYEAFVTAAAILEQIGSLENAFGEGQKAVNAIRVEVEEAKAELAKMKAGVAKAKADNDANYKTALNDAAKIKADAGTEAARIVADAKAEGVRINQLATDSAESTNAQGRADAVRLGQQVGALRIEIAELNDRACAANEAAMEAEKRLAKVKDTIAKMSAA